MRFETQTAKRALLAGAIAGFGGVPAAAVYRWDWSPSQVWDLCLLACIAVLFAIAAATGARLLVDERGRWSLARLQLLIWTVLLLPTFWTMTLVRLHAGAADPLALGLDQDLWKLLGISAASFVASPLILERKRGAAEVGEAPGVRDLFRGEDPGTREVVDIGRVQMFFFTAVAVCAYFAACAQVMASARPAAIAFPPVSDSLLALLGISHATYLANKLPERPASTSA